MRNTRRIPQERNFNDTRAFKSALANAQRTHTEIDDPDSPSIKRTSKLFSGKRSIDITTHNGLKIKAESYRNLHAKTIKKSKNKFGDEMLPITPVRVQMGIKSDADGAIIPLPNSFLNKQLVKQSMSPINESNQTLSYMSPAQLSPMNKKRESQRNSNNKMQKEHAFSTQEHDANQSFHSSLQSKQGNKDIQPLLQEIYNYFDKEPEQDDCEMEKVPRKTVSIFRKDAGGRQTIHSTSPVRSEPEEIVIAPEDNIEGHEDNETKVPAWQPVKRHDLQLTLIGALVPEVASPKGVSPAQSRQSQSTIKMLAKRYSSTKSSGFNKEVKVAHDNSKFEAKQMQTSLQTIIDSATGSPRDPTQVSVENFNGRNMVFAVSTNPNVSLNKVSPNTVPSSRQQMIASNPTSITDAGNQISEIAHNLIIPGILSKPMLSRDIDDNTQDNSRAVSERRQQVNEQMHTLSVERQTEGLTRHDAMDSPKHAKKQQHQLAPMISNKKIFQRASPAIRSNQSPSPSSSRALLQLNKDLHQFDVLDGPFHTPALEEQVQYVYEVDYSVEQHQQTRNLSSITQSGGYTRHNSNTLMPIKNKKLEQQSIPQIIRMAAIFEKNINMGPSTQNIKAKKVENTDAIKHRVTRANCCLKPQRPEDVKVLAKAVGDSSEFLDNPFSKASLVRLKFLNSNFCQGITEDFMSIQNLDRRIDATIVATDGTFRQYEIFDAEEQQLVARLFKRFFFATIQRKYGYLKANAQDKIEISGRLFMGELELNPKVLRLSGVITTFSEDCYLSWPAFLRITALFLLNKELRQIRFEFILRWLHLTSAEQLLKEDYIQDRMQIFQFSGRSFRPAVPSILSLWDLVRNELLPHADELFDHGNAHSMNLEIAEREMEASDIEAYQTFDFFNLIFELS